MNSGRLSLKRTLIAAQQLCPLAAAARHNNVSSSPMFAASSYNRTTITRHHPSVAVLLRRRCLHTSAPRLFADNAPSDNTTTTTTTTTSNSNEPPPIKWTTDRLTADQIAKVDAIFHKILWLDVMETSILMESINQKLGLKLTAKQRAAIERQIEQLDGGAASGEEAAQEQEAEADAGPQLVDVKLTGFDAKAKIKVIKEVRSMAGLGLKEAKELVEGAPTTILKELKPEEAEEIKAKLEGLGATVEIA